ncbi:hypothetical protein [Gracilibacillus sp. JCM 18860]|uniref:hypothetical protein n=1 Tax=Gracilibacillus sp. JCM 18860 TaxID=1306159 RepID=UPI0006D011A8
MITKIDSFEEKPSNWIEYIDSYNKIQEQVEILNEGIENDDNTLIADVILFEFKPTYEKLKNIITYTIDIEGSRKDAN